MAIIANKDDDLKYKKNQIELFFSVHSDVQERAEYLKSAYQDRYTEIIADGQRLGYKPQEDGLLMWEGSYPSRTRESVFSWDIVAQWTAQLIDKKEYFIQTDIPRLPDQESQQMSLFDFAAFNQPAQAEGTAQPSIFPHPALPQQVIDEALCIGANDQNSRLIICAYFKKDKPDNARFLAEHYGENGAGFYLDGRQYAIWYNAEGIRIAQGESAQRSSATLIPGNRRRPVSGNCWIWAGICPRANWTGWTGMNASNGPRSYGISGRILQKAPPTRAIFHGECHLRQKSWISRGKRRHKRFVRPSGGVAEPAG